MTLPATISSTVGAGAAVEGERRVRSRHAFRAAESAGVTRPGVVVEARSVPGLSRCRREKSAMRTRSTQPATMNQTQRDWLESLRGAVLCGSTLFIRHVSSLHLYIFRDTWTRRFCI